MSFRVNGQGGGGGTLAAGSVDATALADNAVTKAKLADAAVGADELDATEAAGVRAAINAYATLPDSGWTTTTSGAAAAARTGGVTTLTADSGGSVLHSIPGYVDPAAPAVDVVARFDYTSGAPGSASYVALCIFDSVSQANGYLVQVDESGIVRLYSVAAGSASQIAFVGTVSLTSGTVWLRLVVTPAGIARAYHGSGSGPTPPSTWTYVGGGQAVSAITPAPLPLVCTRLIRTASGSGTYTVTLSDLQVRVPGLSP